MLFVCERLRTLLAVRTHFQNTSFQTKNINSANVLGQINRASTIIMLPKGVQIGPNNPIRIVNPVAANDINTSTTTTTGSTFNKSPIRQIKSIQLVTSSSIRQGNMPSETLNSSSNLSSQLKSGQMRYIGNKIVQLPGNSARTLNKVNAKVIGTHITSGGKFVNYIEKLTDT